MVDIRQCVLMKVLVYLNGSESLYSLVKGVTFNKISRSTTVAALGWMRVTPAQKKHNKALYELRNTPCTYGYPSTCYDCRIGYSSCSRGCRPATIPENKNPVITITLKGKNLCPKILEEV
jgi:hypothetical protein